MIGCSLELSADELLICTDSGCRPALVEDLESVMQLLPELLLRQSRSARRRHWHLMAERQRREASEGRQP